MNKINTLILLFLILTACKTTEKKDNKFVIAFGSCNNQVLENILWPEIEKNHPSVWIWGGDIIYSDTEDMVFMEQNYKLQKNKQNYRNFIKNKDILGTCDDHDYGLNDGGLEYSKKVEVQQLLLDFLDVEKGDKRRSQEGVYYAKTYTINDNKIKIILLDTRYFRTPLTSDNESNKRYKASNSKDDNMLGAAQWKWLENELRNSKASFNIVVSSIQFLSAEHGYESWGNMTKEVKKFETLLKKTQAENVIILSGDRHISEISKKNIDGLSYPLVDFTSSGMTHSYSNFESEPNKYRIIDVVSDKSFGLLKFDLDLNTVQMEIRGENNMLFRILSQNYN